ncbi:MAG: hypothetical protein HY901_04830 [Deltaproteobacteria bacterium]|nr:hypothetical protein [Deltaproteobacteria bacterium]
MTIERSTFLRNSGAGIGGEGEGTGLAVVDSVVAGTRGAAADSAWASARLGAQLELRGSALDGPSKPGGDSSPHYR